VAFKIRQNPFSAGVLSGPRWGSSRRSPDPIVGWGRDIPPHIPPYSAPTHLRRSQCVPQKSSQKACAFCCCFLCTDITELILLLSLHEVPAQQNEVISHDHDPALTKGYCPFTTKMTCFLMRFSRFSIWCFFSDDLRN